MEAGAAKAVECELSMDDEFQRSENALGDLAKQVSAASQLASTYGLKASKSIYAETLAELAAASRACEALYSADVCTLDEIEALAAKFRRVLSLLANAIQVPKTEH